MAATSSRRARYTTLMAKPDTAKWCVWLALQSSSSDKEYRIIVDGAMVHIQFGRRYVGGQYTAKTFESAEAATKWALRQWASKEAKGYWPITGCLALDDATDLSGVGDGYEVVRSIQVAYNAAVEQAAAGLTSGTRAMLCRNVSPTQVGSTHRVDVIDALAAVTVAGDPGADIYFVAAVDDSSGTVLRGLCPVTIELGDVADSSLLAVGQVAAGLVDDTEAGERAALADAVDLARHVLSCPV